MVLESPGRHCVAQGLAFHTGDIDHERVREVLESYRGRRLPDLLITTTYVVSETVTLIRTTPPRSHAAAKAIQTLVRAQVQAAGLKLPLTPYSLRHGYATHLLQRGADVRHVQKLLGHSQIQTTALYTRVVPQDLKQVLARAHPRERIYNRRRKRAAWRLRGE